METAQQEENQNVWNLIIAGFFGVIAFYWIFNIFIATVNPLYSVTAGNAEGSVTSTKSCMTLEEAKAFISEEIKDKSWTYISEPSQVTGQQVLGGC